MQKQGINSIEKLSLTKGEWLNSNYSSLFSAKIYVHMISIFGYYKIMRSFYENKDVCMQ